MKIHEENCIFRNIFCPSLSCSQSIIFNAILEHYKNSHISEEGLSGEILIFKGSCDTLRKGHFILNNYGKYFFPQFFVNGNLLHFWVVTNGNKTEANLLKAVVLNI